MVQEKEQLATQQWEARGADPGQATLLRDSLSACRTAAPRAGNVHQLGLDSCPSQGKITKITFHDAGFPLACGRKWNQRVSTGEYPRSRCSFLSRGIHATHSQTPWKTGGTAKNSQIGRSTSFSRRVPFLAVFAPGKMVGGAPPPSHRPLFLSGGACCCGWPFGWCCRSKIIKVLILIIFRFFFFFLNPKWRKR